MKHEFITSVKQGKLGGLTANLSPNLKRLGFLFIHIDSSLYPSFIKYLDN